MKDRDPLLFPYMRWAQTESFRSPWCLSQSGMPPPDPALLGPPEPLDLGFPAAPRDELEARLAELFRVAPERVLVTAGGSAAMQHAALRWFRGARVAAEVPSYEPLRALPHLAGAELALFERRLEDGWRLDPDAVAAALAGARGPGHVFLTNPHNPSGVLDEAPAVAACARAAERAGGVLVACEIYQEFLPPDRRVHAFDVAPNAVSIGGLTKAYGLGALRVGWMVLGEDLAAERAHLRDQAFLAYVDPPTPALRAGLRALDKLPELLQPLRRIEAESRPPWEAWLARTPGIEAVVPEFGIVAFPRVVGAEDTLTLQRFLAAEHGVDVVAGEHFGAPGHLRVACGVPRATLVEGLERLTAGLAAWRAR